MYFEVVNITSARLFVFKRIYFNDNPVNKLEQSMRTYTHTHTHILYRKENLQIVIQSPKKKYNTLKIAILTHLSRP